MRDIPRRVDAEMELIADGTELNESTDGNGGGILVGAGQILKAVVKVGDKSGTSPTLDTHIEESDDDSSYTDVVNGAFAQITDAGDWEIVFKTTKAYVREVTAVGGSDTPKFTDCHIYICG